MPVLEREETIIDTCYIVRDTNGQYVGFDGQRTTRLSDAMEFETEDATVPFMNRLTDRVLVREYQTTFECGDA